MAGDRGALGARQPDGIIPASIWLGGGSSRCSRGNPGCILVTSSEDTQAGMWPPPSKPDVPHASHIVLPPPPPPTWGTRASLGTSSGPTAGPGTNRGCCEFLRELPKGVLGKGMDTLPVPVSHTHPDALSRTPHTSTAGLTRRHTGAGVPPQHTATRSAPRPRGRKAFHR